MKDILEACYYEKLILKSFSVRCRETKTASDKLNTVRLKGKWVVCTGYFTSNNIFVFK